jgi:hypothetical protein
VPATSSWSARLGTQYRDGVYAELDERREGKLTAADYACLDSIYFAACGLAEAYALLGEVGWIDKPKRAFFPIVETVLKLQAVLKGDLERLGLDQGEQQAARSVRRLVAGRASRGVAGRPADRPARGGRRGTGEPGGRKPIRGPARGPGRGWRRHGGGRDRPGWRR